MMNCIAIDDEPLALQLLQNSIGKVPYLNLRACCNDAFEAMKVLQEESIDLIFIDIQMPGLSGLQFVNSLGKKPLVIFITAYKEYALDSYELDVVDYLVKPVPLERFIKACNRAEELHELKQNNSIPLKSADYFFVNADYSQVKVSFSDIAYLEALGDYIKIFLKSTSQPLVVRSTIKSILAELPKEQFLRIHKSIIVSLQEISAIRKNSLFIGQQEFSIGETFRQDVENFVNKPI